MELNVHFIDAFTDTRFKGNSAAVIITDNWLSDALMQSIATENNLSETAFLVAASQASARELAHTQYFSIRWFSPITEIAFCGHATLASAFVLFKQDTSLQTIVLTAKAVGELSVEKTESGLIQMDFPNTKPEPVDAIPAELINGLSITPHEVYKNQQAYFVVYPSEHDVRNVLRDNEVLKKLAPLDVAVTAKSESNNNSRLNYDFISRYFWPANGGDEDPVTGSIHTGLAPLWFEKLGYEELELEKLRFEELGFEKLKTETTLTAYQASARGGILYCTLKDNRVIIAGHAVQYLQGTITL